MGRPLLRFSLAGIPVEIQPWFVLMLVLFSLPIGDPVRGAIWAAVAAVSILWHELGHALTQKAFGGSPRIELIAFGGLTHWAPGSNPSALQALLVSAAGPAAGLALGGLLWWLRGTLGPMPYLARVALANALFVNIAWSLFNLLPILPLDGAHVLDHLSRLLGSRPQPRWVGWVSVIVGVALAAWAMSERSTWIALIGGFGVLQGAARLGWLGGAVAERSNGEFRQRARRAPDPSDLPGVVQELLPEARLGKLGERDLATLVGAMVKLGWETQLVTLCRERLTAFARKDDAGTLAWLAAEALAEEGADEEALAVAQLAYRQLNVPHHAYAAAALLVRLARPDEAMEWLGFAVAGGLDCTHALKTDPQLAPLRERPDFAALVARAESRSASAS